MNLKLRAWDEHRKIMHYDFEFISSGDTDNDWIVFKSHLQKLEDNNVLNNPYFKKQFKIQMSVGQGDINGKIVYSDDILVLEKGCESTLYNISWDSENGEFRMYSMDSAGVWSICTNGHHGILKDLRLVGNIHENPNLVEKFSKAKIRDSGVDSS